MLAVGILLPGAILAVFGFRSLRQDRLLAERQTRDALQSGVELAAREVTRELARWPEWNVPGSATLTLTPDGRVLAAHGLLWLPGTLPDPALPSEAQRAEEAEIRQQDFAKAINLYEAALRHASPEAKAVILLRIARTSRKSGDMEKARQSWRRILSLPDSSATPAALLSLVEAGAAPALDFYRGLISGRYPLARESYFFYSGRAQELAGETTVARYRGEERRRIALTEAAEAFLTTPRRNPAPGYVAFWDAGQATLLPEAALRDRLTKAAQAGLDAAITLRPRQSPPAGLAAALPVTIRNCPGASRPRRGMPRPWRVPCTTGRRWFWGSLAVVLATLLSGVCLTALAVRREAELSRLQSEFVATVSHAIPGRRSLASGNSPNCSIPTSSRPATAAVSTTV